MYSYGSSPWSLAVWIKLVMAAARLPAASVPANSQFFRPVAHGRICSSSWFLSMGRCSCVRFLYADTCSPPDGRQINMCSPAAHLGFIHGAHPFRLGGHHRYRLDRSLQGRDGRALTNMLNLQKYVGTIKRGIFLVPQGSRSVKFQVMETNMFLDNVKHFTRCTWMCLLLGLGNVAGAASAQDWPTSKTVTVLNPAAVGGVLDILLRSASDFVAKRIGQNVIVESRSGGAGAIVAQTVATQPADGYVLGGMYTSHVINPHVRKGLPYDTLRDFVPVSLLAVPNLVLIASANAPYSSIPELIAYAKANPDKVSFGVPGMGGAAHFGFESFRMAANMSITVVSYRGEAPALLDVLGGTVNLSLVTTGAAQQHIAAGKLKMLASFTDQRLPSYPNLPSVSEGLPGFKPLVAWYGLFVRAGTPPIIVEKLSTAYRAALADPAIATKLESAGLTLVGSSSAEAAAQISREYQIYGDLIRKTGFKLD